MALFDFVASHTMDAKIGFPGRSDVNDCFDKTTNLHCFEAYRLKVRDKPTGNKHLVTKRSGCRGPSMLYCNTWG